ncbi:MAG TPA: trypsin-like serine protease [Herpetosiphonaceae bacterium]|nr:trypsin-like serine protease [Herpetosiphonaceae bacterium]
MWTRSLTRHRLRRAGPFILLLGLLLAHGGWAAAAPRQEARPEAGVSIMGGKTALQHLRPWMAKITIQENSTTKHLCSASLIAPAWVLTAAHCFYDDNPDGTWSAVNPASLRIILGDYDGTNASTRQTLEVAEHGIYPHREYLPGNGSPADIALVRLRSAARLDASVALITPGHRMLHKSLMEPGKRVFLAGWGYTDSRNIPSDVLQYLEMPLVENPECQKHHSGDIVFPSSWLCAGDGVDKICRGDSGGPGVAQDKDGNWVVLGVNSSTWGECFVTPHDYSLLVRVSDYYDWIITTAGSDLPRVYNGTFEGAPIGWGWTGQAAIRPYVHAHGGDRVAVLGGRNRTAQQLNQTVTVPSNARLSYWWRMQTDESRDAIKVTDYLSVWITDQQGATIKYAKFDNLDMRDTWQQETLDLAKYAGKPIHITFIALTDRSKPTTFFIDDVSLE